MSRCDVDVEYFPTPTKSSVSALSKEDEELLTALTGLAAENFIGSLWPGRRAEP